MRKADILQNIQNEIGTGIKIVAVSKTKPNEAIREIYDCGHKIFGENKVQEMTAKHEVLPKDIEWHFIGHLQTNKVKYIAPFVSYIHSADSLKLIKAIDKEAAKNNRTINCLLQLKIADEDTKFGLSMDEVKNILSSDDFHELKHICFKGVMGMATNTENEAQIKKEFLQLKDNFIEIRDSFFMDKAYFSEISMGMSHDYKVAAEAGSTMVRIGSKIFGERVYN